jgi:hypothetical protein
MVIILVLVKVTLSRDILHVHHMSACVRAWTSESLPTSNTCCSHRYMGVFNHSVYFTEYTRPKICK